MRSSYKDRAARQKPRGSVFIRSCELAVVQRGIGAALREQLRMFTLFSSSSPSVTSLKRRMSEATVDFPLPVPPMIAVVAPRLQVKFSPFRVYSSESAKRNVAFLKVTTFSDAAGNHTFFSVRSCMVGEKSSTTRTPVMFSRSTALILSGSFCSLRKSGEAPRMMKRAMTVMTASTARRISPMTQSFRNARMRFQKA